MPVVVDPDNIPPPDPLINGWEDLLHEIGSQDYIYLDAVDNVQYDTINNIYIKDKTIEQYQGDNKCLLLWVFYK